MCNIRTGAAAAQRPQKHQAPRTTKTQGTFEVPGVSYHKVPGVSSQDPAKEPGNFFLIFQLFYIVLIYRFYFVAVFGLYK